MIKLNLIVIISFFMIQTNAYAYFGPAIGLGILGILLIFILSILIALIAILYIPIKKFILKIKKNIEKNNQS